VSAIQNLREDHRAIERGLGILGEASEKLVLGESVAPESFRIVLDFIVNFADKCHRSKEERNLFRLIELGGIPRPGPLDVMLSEHQEGRRLVKEL